MKVLAVLLFAILTETYKLSTPLSIGSSYALKDKDGVYGIVTME